MRKRTAKGIVWVVLGALLLSGSLACGNKDVRMVARVGNSLITQKQFETAYLKEKPIYVAKRATLAEKESFLRRMMDKKLELLAAYQQGLDKDPKIRERINSERHRIIYFATMDKNVVFKVIKEEEIRDFYEKSKVEVRVRHILFKLPPGASKDAEQKALAKAKKVISELQSGKDFAELAKQYSEDRATASRGGDMGFIKWGRIEEPLQKVIFKMARYQITTEPVRSSRGYHIIQVTDRRIMPQKPYEVERDNIVRILFRKHRDEIMNVYRKFNEKLERRHHVRFVDANIDTLVAYFSRPEVDSTFRTFRRTKDLTFDWMDPKIRAMPLAYVDYKPYRLEDMFASVKERAAGAPLMPMRNTKGVKEMLKTEIDIQLAIRYGERKGYARVSPYRELIAQKIEEILTGAIRQREIHDKIQITEEMKKEYYEKHPEKYMVPAKAKVQEILVEDVDLANRIAQLAKNGANFDRLAERYNTRVTTKNKKGHLGWLTSNSYGVIGRNALQMKVGEIRGPIKVGKRYSILKVLERQEAHTRPYRDVMANVENDLRRELVQKRETEWKNELKRRFPYRMFRDVLEKSLKDLQTQES
ncbi:MAG TPA: hypothetical protein ENJ23_02015 [Bacteroidetes bacterium]|nr:hypothetical protein [Bacteroidota bacterium]